MSPRAASAMQLAAILGLALIVALPLHKGTLDILDIAQTYPLDEFLTRVGRYLFGNLAGGKS